MSDHMSAPRSLAVISTLALITTIASIAGAQNAGPAQPVPVSMEGEVAPVQIEAGLPESRLPGRADRAAAGEFLTIAPIELGAFDASALLAEDKVIETNPNVPIRIGVQRELPKGLITPETDGQWFVDADGTRVWAVEIAAPGAYDIRAHFSKFDLPEGAEVFIFGDAGRAIESYSGRGMMQLGEFWGVSPGGPRLLIEYHDSKGRAQNPTIEIDSITHMYRNPIEPGDPAPKDTQQTQLLACQKDVNCFLGPPWNVPLYIRDSVGRMTFTDGGSFLCSGGLLADIDPNTFAGYFLTANHCLSTQTVVNTLQIYWLYQTNSCGGSTPSLASVPRSTGGTLLTTSPNSDFTFLRTRNDPNQGQGFAGWSTTMPPNTEQVCGVHHPAGASKKVSFGHPVTTGQICEDLPITHFLYNDWDLDTNGQFIGVTEGGSSGSPLFNASWQVVGQLFGSCQSAAPACNNPNQFNNVYGRFNQSYNTGFPSTGSYLISTILDDGFEDNDTLGTAVPIGGDFVGRKLVDFDDYWTVQMCGAGNLQVVGVFSASNMDMDMELRTTGGTLLSSDLSAATTKTVQANVGPGTYVVHCIKSSGWGGDYTMTTTRTFSCTPSADITANCFKDSLDAARLVDILLGSPPTAQELCRGDFNTNGAIEGDDIGPFVTALMTP